MSQISTLSDNAFAALSFLAAPAILTNASTVLALGTSNRLARASDRAKAAATAIVSSAANDPITQFQQQDFQHSTRRATLLIKALRRFYLAAGCFAGGTCIALIGAFAGYFDLHFLDRATQIAMVLAAALGVGGLVHGCFILLHETRLAIHSEAQHAAITQWRATRAEPHA